MMNNCFTSFPFRMERIDSRSRMIVAEQSSRAHMTPVRQQSRQQVHDHHHHHDHEHDEGCGHDHDHHHDHGHGLGGHSDIEMQIRMLHSASGGKQGPGHRHQAPALAKKRQQQPVRQSGGAREPYQVSHYLH